MSKYQIHIHLSQSCDTYSINSFKWTVHFYLNEKILCMQIPRLHTWETPCCRALPAGSWSYWMRDPGTPGCVVWQCLAGCVTMSCHWGAGQWGGWETTGLCWDSLLVLHSKSGKRTCTGEWGPNATPLPLWHPGKKKFPIAANGQKQVIWVSNLGFHVSPTPLDVVQNGDYVILW